MKIRIILATAQLALLAFWLWLMTGCADGPSAWQTRPISPVKLEMIRAQLRDMDAAARGVVFTPRK